MKSHIADCLTELVNRLDIQEVTHLKDLWTLDQTKHEQSLQPRCIYAPKMRVMEYFDYAPNLLIYEPIGQTLGVVIELSAVNVGGENKDTTIDTAVQQAAYFYHLLSNAAQPNPDKDTLELCPSVELVLVLKVNQLQSAGDALRRIARESDLLHVIGVGMISEPFNGADIRRAFPWLLRCAKKWLNPESLPVQPRCIRIPASSEEHSHGLADLILDEIKLEQYRLPEPLTLKLQSHSQFHLLHGPNGTGKSTLVEAIELPMTGRVQRIERDSPLAHADTQAGELSRSERYFKIIQNRNATSNPRITFSGTCTKDVDHKRQLIWELSSTQMPQPLCDPPMTAAAFRLDQRVMDDLAQASENRRAEIFLQAFFPEDKNLYAQVEKARDDSQNALKIIEEFLTPDKSLMPKDRAARFETLGAELDHRFNWLQVAKQGKPNQQQLQNCLPLSLEALEQLTLLEPDLNAALTLCRAAEQGELEERLGQLDQAIEKLMARIVPTITALQAAEEGLSALRPWRAKSKESSLIDFGETLNQWLEACVMHDLADRHYGLIRTQKRAESLGWLADPRLAASFLTAEKPTVAVETLDKERAVWQQRREDFFDQLQQVRNHAQESPETEAIQPRIMLSTTQIEGLNQFGLLLGASTDNGNFGDLCRDAYRQSRFREAGSITIGAENWTEEPIAKLKALLKACHELTTLGSPHDWTTGKKRLTQTLDALSKRSKLTQLEGMIKATFLSKITESASLQDRDSGLDDALNELMALFTPARWAYQDIQVTHRQENNQAQITLGEEGDGSVDASLRLNTAELNLFSLALFLLCAPKLANPLRLLILDDPLQNMDEHTVTALARGLAKYKTILPEHWRLFFLFHGRDDLERFRHHLPEAPVYRLPWLRPIQVNTQPSKPVEIAIDHQPKLEHLKLSTIIKESPTLAS